MTRAIRRRGDADTGAPPDLQKMLRQVEVDYRANVQGELRRHRHFIGPAEQRRLKRRLAMKRLLRARQRQLAARTAA